MPSLVVTQAIQGLSGKRLGIQRFAKQFSVGWRVTTIKLVRDLKPCVRYFPLVGQRQYHR